MALSAVCVVSACDPGAGGADAGRRDDGSTAQLDGSSSDECAGAEDGAACGGAGQLCVDGRCETSRCGDGVLDASAGEDCDDGNEVAFDGCEPQTCAFTCADDTACDDEDLCNGAESCSDSHVCVAAAPADDGTRCSTPTLGDGVCRTGDCVPPGCGNGIVEGEEQCDDGADGDPDDGCRDDCRFTCSADIECDDANVCTGTERCDASHVCVPGESLGCDDGSDCTADRCDPALGCEHLLIDADGDGHAGRELGTCGGDCNDARADIFPGADEVCDGDDNDCDGTADEIAPLWYVDCDDDGFAAGLESAQRACTEPPASTTGCGGGWTSVRPVPTDLTTVDCNDADGAVRPGATEVAGNEVDDDCSGAEICFVDADNDGFRPNTTATTASADTDCADAGEARASEPAGDCRDDVFAIRPNATEIAGDAIDQNCDGRETCFADADNDGFRPSATATVSSSDVDCADSGEARSSDPVGDCCDTDSRAHPGQSAWFDSTDGARACGGWDFSCANGEERRFTAGGSCTRAGTSCILASGWRTSVAACGGSGSFVTSCEYDGESNTCFTLSSTRRQECH